MTRREARINFWTIVTLTFTVSKVLPISTSDECTQLTLNDRISRAFLVPLQTFVLGKVSAHIKMLALKIL